MCGLDVAQKEELSDFVTIIGLFHKSIFPASNMCAGFGARLGDSQ